MKTSSLIVIFLCIISFSTIGQNTLSGPAVMSKTYMAAGLRFGVTSGATLKGFIGNGQAIEGILGVWHHGITTTALYEKYVPFIDRPGFHWFYGAGGHFTFETSNPVFERSNPVWNRPYYGRGIGLGVDGIVGIEYKPQTLPIAFSLDAKPFLEVNTSGGIWGAIDPGIGVKVIF